MWRVRPTWCWCRIRRRRKPCADFIEHARKNPGRLNYASSGNGTIVHLTSEYFKAQSGTFILHIPYRGTALAMPDLISGKVDVLFDSFVTGMPHVRDGKLRVLAVTTLKRTSLAPDMPTVSETLPGFESVTWFGVYGPKGMPPELAGKVNQALNAALADADVKDRFARLGAEPTGSTPAAFAAMVRADTAKWKKIIAERKITAAMHFDFNNPYPTTRIPVFARNVVSTSHPLAAQAGLRMLWKGGNAVDAAIAAAAVMTVCEPVSNGLGSDAFAILWDGKELHGLNASGRAPADLDSRVLREEVRRRQHQPAQARP
jgi:hypothetical protein